MKTNSRKQTVKKTNIRKGTVKRDPSAKVFVPTGRKKQQKLTKKFKEWENLHSQILLKQKELLSSNGSSNSATIKPLACNYTEFLNLREQCKEILQNYSLHFKNSLARPFLEDMVNSAGILASLCFSEQFFSSEDYLLDSKITEIFFEDDSVEELIP